MAVAVSASAAAAIATGLIFHLHPVAIAIGGAWLYRRLEGGRPCSTRSVAFLIGLGAMLSASDELLRPRGLTDAPWLAAAIGITGVAGASWLLFRAEPLALFRSHLR